MLRERSLEGYCRSFARRSVMSCLIFIVSMLLVAVGWTFIGKQVRSPKEVDTQELMSEQIKLMGELKKQDPEGKIPLTKELLESEYREYHEKKRQDIEGKKLLLYCGAWIFVTVLLISFGCSCLSHRPFKKSVWLLIPIPILVAGVLYVRTLSSFQMPPAPDEVTIGARNIEIVKKDTKTSSGDDEYGTSDTVSHRIYYLDGNGKEVKLSVTEDRYNKIKIHDKWIMAYAQYGGETVDFCLYDPDVYRIAGGE